MARREPTTPPLGTDQTVDFGFARAAKYFDTIADLKAQNMAAVQEDDRAAVFSVGGIGSAHYFYDPNSTDTADGVNVVEPDNGGGRWFREKSITGKKTSGIQSGTLDNFQAYYDTDKDRTVSGSLKRYLVGFRDVSIKRNSMSELVGDTPGFWETLFGATPVRTLIGFYDDIPVDGMNYYYDAAKPHSKHDGGSVINPSHLSIPGSSGWYSSTGDGTIDTGSGCWVLINSVGYINSEKFGASSSLPNNGPALNASIKYLVTSDETETGGVVSLPREDLTIQEPLVIYSNHASNLVSITIEGKGQENTTIRAGSSFGIGQSVIKVNQGTFVRLRDFKVAGDNNPDYGINFLGQESGFNAYNHVELKNIRVNSCNEDGFRFERGFLINAQDCFAKFCRNGFNLTGYHTSSTFNGCYANNCGLSGFLIDDISYSSFINCASDGNREGYKVTKASSLSFISCGAEGCDRAAFHFEASQSQDDETNSVLDGIDCSLINCFSVNNDQAASGYGSSIYSNQADTSNIKVYVENFDEYNSPNNLSVFSPDSNNNHIIRVKDSDFNGSVSSSALVLNDKQTNIIKDVSVVSSNTPIADLSDMFGSVSHYSGVINIIATSGQIHDVGDDNIASYMLHVTKAAAGSAVTEISSQGLTAGSSASWPSFTFSMDTTNNHLEATPINSTSFSSFTFYITHIGTLKASQI